MENLGNRGILDRKDIRLESAELKEELGLKSEGLSSKSKESDLKSGGLSLRAEEPVLQEEIDGNKRTSSCLRPVLWAYVGTALVCILVVLTSFSMNVSDLITFPYGLIGDLLRALSLTGSVGNVLSWVLYLGISLLPLGIWLLLRRKSRRLPLDWVLPVFSVLLLGVLYGAINPGILFQITGVPTHISGKMILAHFSIVLNSFLFMCFIIAIMKRCGSDSVGQLVWKLKVFFIIGGLILVVMIFGSGFEEFSDVVRENLLKISYYSAYPGYSAYYPYQISPAVDAVIYVLADFASNYLYLIFGLVLVLLMIRLLETMERDFYGEETVLAAKMLADYSSRFLMVMVVLSFLCNLVKLFYFRGGYDITFSAGIPMMYFGCSILLILVSRNICNSRELKKEHDLFI